MPAPRLPEPFGTPTPADTRRRSHEVTGEPSATDDAYKEGQHVSKTNRRERRTARREFEQARLDYKTARDAYVRAKAHDPAVVSRGHPFAGLTAAEWDARCRNRFYVLTGAWNRYIEAKVYLTSFDA